MKRIDHNISPADSEIGRAVEYIRAGEIIAIPTETYYGLAVDPENDEALAKLFALKRRPLHKPILILISHIDQLFLYTSNIPRQYQDLIEKYWPGPLTLIFPASDHVSTLLSGGSGTIGIRFTPDHCASRIIDLFGKPITATSANVSNHQPARNADEVQQAFGDAIKCVVDGGQSTEGLGSTVVGIKDGKPCLIRKGRVELPHIPDCQPG